MDNTRRQEDSILVLLRICTFLLAAVSFWATARGMREYTFPEGWQAYAASLGIQGLLLGLNFALPSFLKQCKTWLQRIILLALSAVVLFCSSWFSYLFIAGQAYGDSWETESRLLSQAAYREELFQADAYTEIYSQAMQNALTDQIAELYQQAEQMDENKVDFNRNLDWETERSTYAAENSAARDIMLNIIDQMEQATKENVSEDVRTQAASTLSALQTNLQGEIDNLGEQITSEDARIATAEAALHDAQNRLNNAPDNVDLTTYINAVNLASDNYQRRLERQSTLEKQRGDYEDALQRAKYYTTILGMAEEGVSIYFVGANLREIQSELFGEAPDSDRMLDLATEVFNRLQSAVDLGGAKSLDGGEKTVQYEDFLASMNRFVQNLKNYRTIKVSNTAIQEKLEQLADGSILSLDVSDNDWQSAWLGEFNDLKSKISGLPVYTLQGDVDKALTSFDREASTRSLDQAIRRYLTDHNAAQQGLIYLASPYRGVAVFSLFLALLLDIAAFITGVIIDRVSSRRKEADEANPPVAAKEARFRTEKNPQSGYETDWEAVPMLNRYVFLTGDYDYTDGILTYRAIENGEKTEIEYADKDLPTGFYQWKGKRLCPVDKNKLLFKGTSGGPQDGVYEDSSLHYENQLLTITQGEESAFLGTAGPNIPVYRMSEDQYEVLPVKSINHILGHTVVIALNKDGSRIISIYVM